MAGSETNNRLSVFLKTGIYRFVSSNAVFIDPVRVLNRSYTRFKVSPTAYYSRFFDSKKSTEEEPRVSKNSRKRERKERKSHNLNEKEQLADQRHKDSRDLLLKAHEALIGTTDLLAIIRKLRNGEEESKESLLPSVEQSFVELGSVWQAPLYDITLNLHQENQPNQSRGSLLVENCDQRVIPVFNNLVINETSSDAEAEFLNNKYVIPKESCFYMSDLRQIHNMIPAESDCGFNLIVVDPPWENSSARQKMKYPTLPSRYFLSLPIKQLTHAEGALVALWVTNREKLRDFVVNELFPKWGVNYAATLYWLKVKPDGSLINELDLFHHRPYECLLLGYCGGKAVDSECLQRLTCMPDDQVFISVPGDYSRKPPVGELLQEYMPGFMPVRCIELFAREMMAGWASWGNEPLHFQDARYFSGNAAKYYF